MIDLAIARDFDREPFGNGVNTFGADTVSAARIGIATLPIFAAGVERGQDEFDAGDFVFGMDVNGDATAIIADGNGAIHVNGHINAVALSGKIFVNGVVEHFGDAMMQGAFIGAANVHARFLPDSFQPLQFPQFGGIITLRRRNVFNYIFSLFQHIFLRHKV